MVEVAHISIREFVEAKSSNPTAESAIPGDTKAHALGYRAVKYSMPVLALITEDWMEHRYQWNAHLA
jgi:hypothetical protein